MQNKATAIIQKRGNPIDHVAMLKFDSQNEYSKKNLLDASIDESFLKHGIGMLSESGKK